MIGTWSTLALIGAAAMLIQIPYSLDELLATLQFMRRRVKAGRNWLRLFLFGDTDEGNTDRLADEGDQVCGDGWADLREAGFLEGKISYHNDDETTFIGSPWKAFSATR